MIPIPRLELTAASLKLMIGIACALLLALLIHDRNQWKAKASQHVERLAGEQAAHAATVANYRVAAEQARSADAANIARVKTEQAAINERTAYDFESRIAAARAAARRLRRTAGAAADSRPRGSAPVPAIPNAAQGSAQAAGEDGFPRSDRLIATEQAIQLDELIIWVRAQANVDGGERRASE